MTEAEAEALGKRVVACKGFRPMRGMLDMQGRSWGADLLFRWSNDVGVPDLRDPATLGCLLALVREALHSPRAHVLYVAGLHRWECADNRVVLGVGATEAEAIVAALEEAP